MTTFATDYVKCSRCGQTSEFNVLSSTNAFGPCDLDTRPPEMKRSTMFYWVQECPHCGYVGDEISDSTTAPDELFDSEAYLSYGGIKFASELAKKFYRLYLVKMAEKNDVDAFWAALNAAWASDDKRDDASAVACRKLALERIEPIIADEPDSDNYKLMKLDLLRRVREFDAVLEYGATLKIDEEFLARIVALELELAKRRDDACHTCAEA